MDIAIAFNVDPYVVNTTVIMAGIYLIAKAVGIHWGKRK